MDKEKERKEVTLKKIGLQSCVKSDERKKSYSSWNQKLNMIDNADYSNQGLLLAWYKTILNRKQLECYDLLLRNEIELSHTEMISTGALLW